MDVADDDDELAPGGRLAEESNEDTDEGTQSETPKYRLLVVRPGREGELRAESEDEEEERFDAVVCLFVFFFFLKPFF
jgi:hypothetical protein